MTVPSGNLMEEPQCCCCFSIRKGTVILALVELILLGAEMANAIYYIVDYDKLLEDIGKTSSIAMDQPPIDNKNIDKYVMFCQLGVNGVQLLAVLALLYGVISAIPSMLIPHLAIQIISCVLMVGRGAVWVLTFGLKPYTLITLAVYMLIVIVFAYFTYIVWLCYTYLKVTKFIARESHNEITSM